MLHASLPRHPLLRALVLVIGAVLLAGLLAAGLVIGTLVVTLAALVMLVRRWRYGRRQRSVDPAVIEGEFTVVAPRPRSALPHTE